MKFYSLVGKSLALGVFEHRSESKGYLEALLVVQSRITEAFVVFREVELVNILKAAETLAYVLTCQFEVNSSQEGALLQVNAKGLVQFA